MLKERICLEILSLHKIPRCQGYKLLCLVNEKQFSVAMNLDLQHKEHSAGMLHDPLSVEQLRYRNIINIIIDNTFS